MTPRKAAIASREQSQRARYCAGLYLDQVAENMADLLPADAPDKNAAGTFGAGAVSMLIDVLIERHGMTGAAAIIGQAIGISIESAIEPVREPYFQSIMAGIRLGMTIATDARK